MYQFLLISILFVGVCLILAYLLIKRRMAIIAILLGLLALGGYQFYLQRSLDSSIQACIERACQSAGLPPDCPEAQFGCTEWSGLSAFVFYITGFAQVIIFTVGAGIMAFLASRQRRDRSSPMDANPGDPAT